MCLENTVYAAIIGNYYVKARPDSEPAANQPAVAGLDCKDAQEFQLYSHIYVFSCFHKLSIYSCTANSVGISKINSATVTFLQS